MMKKSIMFVLSLCVVMLLCGMVYAEGSDEESEEAIKPVKNQMIIINKNVNQLAFYEDGELIRILPVATGLTEKLTPEGDFKVIKMIKNQTYYKLNIPGGDPRNPLGPRWIGLDVPGTWGYTYGIHGNNAPWTIGTYASAGCVRMYNEDVKWLYDKVELGARVIITRSSGTFEQIAKNKGYLMVDAKAGESKAKITLGKKIAVYERPSKTFKTVGTVNPQTMQVKKQYKNWYYIEDGNVKGWVKDDSVNELDSVVEVLGYYMDKFFVKDDNTKRLHDYWMNWWNGKKMRSA